MLHVQPITGSQSPGGACETDSPIKVSGVHETPVGTKAQLVVCPMVVGAKRIVWVVLSPTSRLQSTEWFG